MITKTLPFPLAVFSGLFITIQEIVSTEDEFFARNAIVPIIGFKALLNLSACNLWIILCISHNECRLPPLYFFFVPVPSAFVWFEA